MATLRTAVRTAVVGLSALLLMAPTCRSGAPGPRIVGYFPSWAIYARDYQVADIPAELLTHVNYAFADVSVQGECKLGDPWADVDQPHPGDLSDDPVKGNFKQLQLLKAAHPHLRTLLSVGGWTFSAHFSDAALTPDSRAAFAASCVSFVRSYGFDGLDIDWEYPVGGGLSGNTGRPEDRENFTHLLAEVRLQLDQAAAEDGASYLLSIAAPAGPWSYANLELDRIHEHVDWINLMAYDFAGSWSSHTAFHAPLYPASDDPASPAGSSAHEAIEAYLAAGVPAGKLVLGVPFYGRGWQGVPDLNGGLYQTHSGVSMGTWEPGVFDFHDLAANFVPIFERFHHAEAEVPWLYDPASGVMISYEDPSSLTAKARYVQDLGLSGVMAWELSADDANASLLHALHTELSP
jgi:chitinase